MRPERAAQRLAGLSMVRDRNSRLEKARQHLSPTAVGLGRLIANGRIAKQINRRHFNSGDLDRANARMRVVEFKRQLLVPSPPFSSLFTILSFDSTIAGNMLRTPIHREGPRPEPPTRLF